MPRPNSSNTNDKAKDFKKAIGRLFKELKDFKVLIFLSLILAVLGAILSILAPNKLSDLTDKISNGLVVNTSNMKKITTSITNSLNEEELQTKIPKILDMNLSSNSVKEIMASSTITNDEKKQFQEFLESMNTSDQKS